MRRSTILLAAALVALPALAGAQTTKSDTGKPAATSREKGKKAASPAKSAAKPSPASPASPASRASPASKASGAAANPGLNPAARAEMLRRRSTFRYAAESCAEGRDRCNPDLLDEAEKMFVNACRACDTVDRCDAERVAVRGGETNVTTKLCVPAP